MTPVSLTYLADPWNLFFSVHSPNLGAHLPSLACKNFLSVLEADRELNSLQILLPLEKYDSHDLPVFGSYLMRDSGTYVFLFDNRDTKSTARLTEFSIEVTLSVNPGRFPKIHHEKCSPNLLMNNQTADIGCDGRNGLV
jgi:hypothetical protein